MLIIVKDARVYPACKLDKLACFSFIDAARKHKILHLETMNFSREHSRQHELYVHIQLLPVAHKFRGDGAEVDTGRCWICFTTKAHFAQKTPTLIRKLQANLYNSCCRGKYYLYYPGQKTNIPSPQGKTPSLSSSVIC